MRVYVDGQQWLLMTAMTPVGFSEHYYSFCSQKSLFLDSVSIKLLFSANHPGIKMQG